MAGRSSGRGCSPRHRGLPPCGRVLCPGLWRGLSHRVHPEPHDPRWPAGIGHRDGGMEAGSVVRKTLKASELRGGRAGEALALAFGGGDARLLAREANCVVRAPIAGGLGCACTAVAR